MKRGIILILALSSSILPNILFAEVGSRDGSWQEGLRSPMPLGVTSIEVRYAGELTSTFRQDEIGDRRSSSPGLVDAYTIGEDPFVEEYFFPGGPSPHVNHTVVVANNTGPWPTPVSLAFGWQPCGNGVIFPPVPATLGTSLDGTEIGLTLPYSGAWYIIVGVRGFDVGDWDWMALARYDGLTPIPVPPTEETDAYGGMPVSPWTLFGVSGPGEGRFWERPWCFQVQP